jgi:GNAT superfamily N-acetyltransferase
VERAGAARVTIGSASPSDLRVLREIYRRSSLSNAGDEGLFAEHPELLEWPDDALRQGRTRVAAAGGRIIGFATLAAGDGAGELEDLFVDPAWMRRGVGSTLIEDTAGITESKGWSRIEVDANPDALAFYERLGFLAVGAAALRYGTGVRMRLDVHRA